MLLHINIFCSSTTTTHYYPLWRFVSSLLILIQLFSTLLLYNNAVVDGETTHVSGSRRPLVESEQQRRYSKLPNNAGYNALTELPQDLLLQNVGNPIYPKDLMEQIAFDAFQIIHDYSTSASVVQEQENSSMEASSQVTNHDHPLPRDDAANGSSSGSSSSNSNTATRKKQQQTKDAVSYLQANEYRATVTLGGYKGGDITKQINQDRAVIISPYTWWVRSNDEQQEGDQNQKNKFKGSSTIKDIHEHDHDFFIGVFDGHGPYGEFVSQYAATTLPKLLAHRLYEHYHSNKTITMDPSTTTEEEELRLPEEIIQDISDIITFTFIDIDSTIPDTSSARRGGCTASVVLRYGATLFIANAGDSISFVATTTTTPSNVITSKSKIHYQTREDKPHLPEERKRIESFGGRVSIPNREGGTSRVHYGNYGLAMSRSLGDWEAGVLGVIPDPIIHTINIPKLLRKEEEAVITETKQDNNNDDHHQCIVSSTGNTCEITDGNHGNITMFVVSGTDGLFDYVTPEIVAEEIASTILHPSIRSATKDDEFPLSSMLNLIETCGKLVLTSANGWNEQSRGAYRDDIAIAVHTVVL
jgi:serine/threonine protein phosphatase PrpC